MPRNPSFTKVFSLKQRDQKCRVVFGKIFSLKTRDLTCRPSFGKPSPKHREKWGIDRFKESLLFETARFEVSTVFGNTVFETSEFWSIGPSSLKSRELRSVGWSSGKPSLYKKNAKFEVPTILGKTARNKVLTAFMKVFFLKPRDVKWQPSSWKSSLERERLYKCPSLQESLLYKTARSEVSDWTVFRKGFSLKPREMMITPLIVWME